jgi:SAM-dependent methyltransferase
MRVEFERKYHSYEKEHWWFRARREMIIFLLKKYANKDAAILDVGCSGGILLRELQLAGFTNITGIDISRQAIYQCKKEGIANVLKMDAQFTDFEVGKFDFVIASDILEHIEKDRRALQEWQRILKPGGILLLFVPAFQQLWGKHDELNEHKRRYDKNNLSALMAREGYRLIKQGYWNMISLPVAFFLKMAEYLKRKLKIVSSQNSRLVAVNFYLNKLIFSWMKVENYLAEMVGLPWGLSIFIIAKKEKRL